MASRASSSRPRPIPARPKRSGNKTRRRSPEPDKRVQERTTRLEQINLALRKEIEQRRRFEESLHEALSALQESERRYRQLVELAPDGIAVHSEGTVRYANPAALRLLGATDPSQVVGKPTLDFVHPDYRELVQERVRASVQANVVAPLLEERFIRLDGSAIDVDVMTIPTSFDGRPAIQAVFRDITQRKQAEASLQQAMRQVEGLNADLQQRALELEAANQELESFSYSVSHDLRTPLATMDNLITAVLADAGPELAPTTRQMLNLAHANAAAMQGLIESLLQLSRSSRQPLHKERVDVVALVGRVWDEMAEDRTGRQVELVVGELPPCQADPVLLKQVWANLLCNALKFTRKRQVAQIKVATMPARGPSSDSRYTEPVYYVQDNGVGFDNEDAEKLFRVFQRAHSEEEYEGTGVGLAIVERIIRRHGGRVCAEGRVDEGARFYFTLGPVRSEE